MGNKATFCMVLLLLVSLVTHPSQGVQNERNVQRFVQIELPKIYIKATTEANFSTSTTPTSLPTSIAAKSSEAATTVASFTTTSNVPAKENVSATTTTPSSTTVATWLEFTTSASVNSKKPDEIKPSFPFLDEGRVGKQIPRDYFCECDLKINSCDLNCCCDIDCNQAILKAFNCDSDLRHPEKYHDGEGLQSCHVQGGLFCLVEPIYEQSDTFRYDPKMMSVATKNKWKSVFCIDPTSPGDVPINHYRVDEIIHYFNEIGDAVQSFALPFSLIDDSCQSEQSVRFLRESSTLCRRTVDELALFNRAFLANYQNAKFLRIPNKSTVMEKYCVKDQDCINVVFSICHTIANVDSQLNYSRYCNTTTNSTADVLLDESNETGSCRTLEIMFYHNYTQLLEVRINLLCSDDLPELWGESLCWQRVEVTFPVVKGKHSSAARAISGNKGYLIGKPLIVSHLEDTPNRTLETGPETITSTKSDPIIAYFTNGTHLSDEFFHLRLPVSKANRCELSGALYQTVNFGVDAWHQCNFVQSSVANTSSVTQNYTELCRTLQNDLYSQLLHGIRNSTDNYGSLNLYLSKYANPTNRTADWIRVHSVNVIQDTLLPDSGLDSAQLLGNGHSHFVCSNMLISVNYHFYYARELVQGVRQQAVLHAGEIVFGPRVNLRFRKDEEVRVPIFVQVQFFDLTSSSALWDRISPSLAVLCLVYSITYILHI